MGGERGNPEKQTSALWVKDGSLGGKQGLRPGKGKPKEHREGARCLVATFDQPQDPNLIFATLYVEEVHLNDNFPFDGPLVRLHGGSVAIGLLAPPA